MFEERKAPIEISLYCERKLVPKCSVFEGFEGREPFEDRMSGVLPSEVVLLERRGPAEAEKARATLGSFNKLRIDRRMQLRNPFFSCEEEEKAPMCGRISVEELNIYTLFKEMEEKDRAGFDETIRGLKRNNNEKLRSTKYERIVDKSCKSFFEISQEVSLDKILSVSVRLRGCEKFALEVENTIENSSFELFIDLKRIQKIHELNLIENSQWVSLDILGNKLMKNKLFEALLNQLIKASKYVVDRNAGVYYCVERVAGESNACMLNMWVALEKVADLKLRISIERPEENNIKIESFDLL